MSFEDFVKHFDRLEMCLLEPGSLGSSEGKTGKTWEMYQACGDWRRDSTAGGCRKYLATFTRNPQYRYRQKSNSNNSVSSNEIYDHDIASILYRI